MTKAELSDLEIVSLITSLSAAEAIAQIRFSGELKKKEIVAAGFNIHCPVTTVESENT